MDARAARRRGVQSTHVAPGSSDDVNELLTNTLCIVLYGTE